jgi:hypothetical protein
MLAAELSKASFVVFAPRLFYDTKQMMVKMTQNK